MYNNLRTETHAKYKLECVGLLRLISCGADAAGMACYDPRTKESDKNSCTETVFYSTKLMNSAKVRMNNEDDWQKFTINQLAQ